MNKLFPFIFLLFAFSKSFSQTLICNSNGNIKNSDGQNYSTDEVRELLKDNQELLDNYESGRTKKTIGNVLLVAAPIFLITDLIYGMNAKVGTPLENAKTYPNGLTYIGLAAILIAIPVKIGFLKKIRNVVSEYNNLQKVGFKPNDKELNLISNSNGIGLRLTFN